jgi:hypothetical protein
LGWEADIVFRGNTGVLSTHYVPTWVPFRSTPLVPFGMQNYTTSDAFY